MLCLSVSVCSGQGAGHVIITHDALDRTIQGSSLAPVPPLKTWDMGTPLTLALATFCWWPLLETCPNLFIGPHCTDPPTGTDI